MSKNIGRDFLLFLLVLVLASLSFEAFTAEYPGKLSLIKLGDKDGKPILDKNGLERDFYLYVPASGVTSSTPMIIDL